MVYITEANGSATARSEHLELAERQVLTDLVDALFAENGYGILDRGEWISREGRDYWRVDCSGGEQEDGLDCRPGSRVLLLPVQPGSVAAYRCGSAEVLEIQSTADGGHEERRLHAVDLMHLLEATQGQTMPNFANFVRDLETAVAHTALSLEAADGSREAFDPLASFAAGERLASFRDRPFHPTARVKGGWEEADNYRRFSPEFGNTITMNWLAVRRDLVLAGPNAKTDAPADWLLNAEEQEQLQAELDAKGFSAREYLAVPVHPWQMTDVLPREFAGELASGACVPLSFRGGSFAATSSVRSLAPAAGGSRHLKVPIGITSLGVMRYLPAVYLLNGDCGQKLLTEVLAKDDVLKQKVHLCDEASWWAYFPPGTSYYDDKPCHLSCQIREYPEELLADGEVTLLPMSALAVDQAHGRPEHAFDLWWHKRTGQDVTTDAVYELFEEVCSVFFELTVRLLRHGVLPEVHGQNVVLVIRSGRLKGLLLRDHDSVRMHLPWLEAAGHRDPEFIVKKGRPNSLYNPTPEKLVFYLQTLGIQVNLYAILDSLIHTYPVEEQVLWNILIRTLQHAIAQAGFTEPQQELVERMLFQADTWPHKCLILPLLHQQGPANGSMPASQGLTVNPLRKRDADV